MEIQAKSIRPFIGAKNFEVSRGFYRDLGFQEVTLGTDMSLFKTETTAFYLQKAYVKDWIDNTMIFVEVADVTKFWADVNALNLPAKYPGARTVPIRTEGWGRECFVHDPSGVLWHFGEFFK